MGYRLASVEDVRAAVDAAESTQVDALIARHLMGASDAVRSLCSREFTPWFGTRYFSWPNDQMSTSWRLWLDADELAAQPERIEASGVEITDYFCEPANAGPPYNRVELDLATAATFAGGLTPQRAVAITGAFCGCPIVSEALGELVGTIGESDTSATLTAAAQVGNLLVLGSEYVEVTALAWATADTMSSSLPDDSTVQTITLNSGIDARPGELLLIDAELVRVRDVAGLVLIVERAAGGSALASHSNGAAVHARRVATLARGACGTIPASHAATSPVRRHVVPEAPRSLTIAETLYRVQRDAGSWATATKVAGGTTATELERMREDVKASHGRNLRKRAI